MEQAYGSSGDSQLGEWRDRNESHEQLALDIKTSSERLSRISSRTDKFNERTEYFHSWNKGQSKPQNHQTARRMSHSDGKMVSPRLDPADSSFMALYNERISTGFDKNTSVVLSNSEEVSEGTLGYIRSWTIDGLPSSHDAHRKVLLSVHSDVVGFMTDQFGETINPDTTLGSVITLSGSA